MAQRLVGNPSPPAYHRVRSSRRMLSDQTCIEAINVASHQVQRSVISPCTPPSDLAIDMSQLERTESAFLACTFAILGLLVLWRSVQFDSPTIADEVGEKKKKSGWRR